MAGLLEQNLVAVASAAAAFISAWAVNKTKVEHLEKRVKEHEKLFDEFEKVIQANKVLIERREEGMRDIYRRLDKIDDLKIEASLVEIKTELNHIRVSIVQLLERRDN